MALTRTRSIHWATLPEPFGRRPVCVLTRNAALLRLTRVTVAPITRTIRSIRSEVPVGPEQGLRDPSVIACDNVITVPQNLLEPQPIGVLGTAKRRQLDRALRYALAIRG